jgi:BCD family chlorophyll transporter-like MFS transporter
MAVAGLIRDSLAVQVKAGNLFGALNDPSVPYSVVYHLETFLLFGTLVALGPLVRLVRSGAIARPANGAFGLADLPA